MFLVIFSTIVLAFLLTFNTTCLRFLIDDGKMNHPLFTRSIRAVFIIPPLAILFVLGIAIKQSLKDFIKNVKFIMTKRVD